MYVERVEDIEDLLGVQCEYVRVQCVLIGYLKRDLKLAHVKKLSDTLDTCDSPAVSIARCTRDEIGARIGWVGSSASTSLYLGKYYTCRRRSLLGS